MKDKLVRLLELLGYTMIALSAIGWLIMILLVAGVRYA